MQGFGTAAFLLVSIAAMAAVYALALRRLKFSLPAWALACAAALALALTMPSWMFMFGDHNAVIRALIIAGGVTTVASVLLNYCAHYLTGLMRRRRYDRAAGERPHLRRAVRYIRPSEHKRAPVAYTMDADAIGSTAPVVADEVYEADAVMEPAGDTELFAELSVNAQPDAEGGALLQAALIPGAEDIPERSQVPDEAESAAALYTKETPEAEDDLPPHTEEASEDAEAAPLAAAENLPEAPDGAPQYAFVEAPGAAHSIPPYNQDEPYDAGYGAPQRPPEGEYEAVESVPQYADESPGVPPDVAMPPETDSAEQGPALFGSPMAYLLAERAFALKTAERWNEAAAAFGAACSIAPAAQERKILALEELNALMRAHRYEEAAAKVFDILGHTVGLDDGDKDRLRLVLSELYDMTS